MSIYIFYFPKNDLTETESRPKTQQQQQQHDTQNSFAEFGEQLRLLQSQTKALLTAQQAPPPAPTAGQINGASVEMIAREVNQVMSEQFTKFRTNFDSQVSARLGNGGGSKDIEVANLMKRKLEDISIKLESLSAIRQNELKNSGEKLTGK